MRRASALEFRRVDAISLRFHGPSLVTRLQVSRTKTRKQSPCVHVAHCRVTLGLAVAPPRWRTRLVGAAGNGGFAGPVALEFAIHLDADDQLGARLLNAAQGCLIVLQGAAEFRIEDNDTQVVRFEKGDSVELRPGVWHAFTALSEEARISWASTCHLSASSTINPA